MARRFKKVIIERAPGIWSVKIGHRISFDELSERFQRASEAITHFGLSMKRYSENVKGGL